MEDWRSVIVNYNSQFDDQSNYIGGNKRLGYILASNVSLTALRDAISYILSAEAIRGEYQIYSLSTSRSGRMLRSIIGSDMNLLRLFTMEPEPTVYLVHNQNVGGTQPEPFTVQDVITQPESSTYYPTNTQPDPYSYVSQFDCSAQPSFNPTDDDIEHFGRSNWLSDNWWGSGSGIEPQYEAEAAPNTNADDDYDDEADLDVLSEDDEEPFGTGFSNCTFHDFTSWIRREGGINQLLSMLVLTNQPTASHSQVEPEPEDNVVMALSLGIEHDDGHASIQNVVRALSLGIEHDDDHASIQNV
ncbi:hypothetical protein C2S52_001619 [Perilla frutescens var. hirtella]|nr:hypothetical protein C2S52_001619 [Perilla frutescens var. hirtella]